MKKASTENKTESTQKSELENLNAEIIATKGGARGFSSERKKFWQTKFVELSKTQILTQEQEQLQTKLKKAGFDPEEQMTKTIVRPPVKEEVPKEETNKFLKNISNFNFSNLFNVSGVSSYFGSVSGVSSNLKKGNQKTTEENENSGLLSDDICDHVAKFVGSYSPARLVSKKWNETYKKGLSLINLNSFFLPSNVAPSQSLDGIKAEKKEFLKKEKIDILFVGKPETLKTSVFNALNRVTKTSFELDNVKQTVGTEFLRWQNDSKDKKFEVWDSAGQNRFKSIATAYYRGKNLIVIFANDPTNLSTFLETKNQYAENAAVVCMVQKYENVEHKIENKEYKETCELAKKNGLLVATITDNDPLVIAQAFKNTLEKAFNPTSNNKSIGPGIEVEKQKLEEEQSIQKNGLTK